MKHRLLNPVTLAAVIAICILLGTGAFTRVWTPVHAAILTPVVHASVDGRSQPVLVELFTSEGCSSCPPADALLGQLDTEQFAAGAQAIVLSEHVSYWNDLGWHDPFSSQAFTDRQNEYGSRFSLSGVYTPQAVVDGEYEVVGSDRAKLVHAVESAATKPKVLISLEDVRWSDNAVTAQVQTGAFPKAILMAALADDSDRSSVLRGENQGRDLRHVAVVRTLIEIRKTAGPLDKLPIRISLPAGAHPQSKMRLVVFLTDGHTGHVLGVAMQAIPIG
ncbi:DUF1223 domain-containing protein [Acidicapsa ligni]|uniref:DUF1223 domain-containing protein n=1 Tax=Acidicapsa ligni TaxID=542300 RepID=UPI0021DFE824|nr:DUF1223 domain-containing protein [Acidicapsa ligni]